MKVEELLLKLESSVEVSIAKNGKEVAFYKSPRRVNKKYLDKEVIKISLSRIYQDMITIETGE